MKLLIFLSGACLGTVIGILIGYQVIDDQLREKTQLKQAEQGHAHSKTTPPADPPTTNPKHQPDSVRKMLNKLQEYVRQNPDDPEGWHNLAKPYREIGRWAQVVTFLEKAMALKPKDPVLLSDLAEAYHHEGKDTKALELFRQALQIKPKDEAAGWGLSLVLYRAGEYSQALEQLKKLDKHTQSSEIKRRIKALRATIQSKKKD